MWSDCRISGSDCWTGQACLSQSEALVGYLDGRWWHLPIIYPSATESRMSEALIGPVCLLYLPITHRIQNVWVSHCGCLSTVCTHPSQTPGCLVGLSSAMVNLNYQFDWNEKHTDYFLSVCRGLSREDKLSQERPTWNVGSTIYEVWGPDGIKGNGGRLGFRYSLLLLVYHDENCWSYHSLLGTVNQSLWN